MKKLTFYTAVDKEAYFCVNFTEEKDAELAAQGNGFYGSDASVINQTITIYESFDEWKKLTKKTLAETNPELYNTIKNLSNKQLEILQKNGLVIDN